MTSRRALLAGLGTAASATLAGCASITGSDEQSPEQSIDRMALQRAVPAVELPVDPLPITPPDSLATSHRDRAASLLDDVPESPDVPNGVVASRLGQDRERAAEHLAEGSDESRPLERLRDWRAIRQSAAEVRGAYRAATGLDDAESVRVRRKAVRSGLGALAADVEYRASDPVEAVLVYGGIEELVGDAQRHARPIFPYPDDPQTAVEDAGQAVGAVEDAVATFADARGLRSAYHEARPDANRQWVTLAEAAGSIDYSVDSTLQPVRQYSEQGQAAFDRDVSGTVGGTLFRAAFHRARDGPDDVRDKRQAGDYALAIRQSARNLVAAVVLKRVVADVEDEAVDDEVTADGIEQTAAAARAAIERVEAADHPRLAASIAAVAAQSYGGGLDYLGERFYDPADALVGFEYARRYAELAPQAAAFVAERLAAAD